MRRLVATLALIGLISCNSTNSNLKYKIFTQGNFREYANLDTTQTVEIERHIVDFDFDAKGDTLILEHLKELIGDPQIYSILKVVLSTKEQYIVKNVTGYTIDKQVKLVLKNRVNSKNIFLPDLGNHQTVLCIWDYQYPDCTNRFGVLAWERKGFKTLFQENVKVHTVTWQQENNHFLLDISRNCGDEKDKVKIYIDEKELPVATPR